MIDEPFAEGTSILHRMDATAKILAALFFTLPAATTNRFSIAAGFGLLSLFLVFIARLPFLRVVKRLLLVNAFTLFLLITLPLTYGGNQILLFSRLPISIEGLQLGLLITLKTNTILLAIMALLTTSNISVLGYGLERLGVPLRLCYLVLFCYRYIFVIEQEFKRLLRAAQVRCFSPSTSLHTYRTFGYLFGMTLVKSWEQAHRVHQAMILRGFQGRFIPLARQSMDAKSYLLITTITVSCLILVLLEYLPS